MIWICETTEIRLSRPSVVIIGKFDGLHRGHRKILEEARRSCPPGGQVVMFTFARMPRDEMLGKAGAGLTTREEKRRMAEAAGVDVFVEYPFTEEVRRMTAETFLRDILIRDLGMCGIVAGPDCSFGYMRQGNVRFLEEHRQESGYFLKVVPKEYYRGEAISSTRIREALKEGRMEDAEAMLGYPFGYCSEILHGRRLGRQLGFPTLNQMIPPEKVIPAFGVYAAEAELMGERFRGIANVGVKPTISGKNAAGVETHIYDFHREVSGEPVQVGLKHFVRPERRFASLEELKRQVEADLETVRRLGGVQHE